MLMVDLYGSWLDSITILIDYIIFNAILEFSSAYLNWFHNFQCNTRVFQCQHLATRQACVGFVPDAFYKTLDIIAFNVVIICIYCCIMAIFMKLSKSSYSVEKSILSNKKGLFLRYKKLTRKFVLERVKNIFFYRCYVVLDQWPYKSFSAFCWK